MYVFIYVTLFCQESEEYDGLRYASGKMLRMSESHCTDVSIQQGPDSAAARNVTPRQWPSWPPVQPNIVHELQYKPFSENVTAALGQHCPLQRHG